MAASMAMPPPSPEAPTVVGPPIPLTAGPPPAAPPIARSRAGSPDSRPQDLAPPMVVFPPGYAPRTQVSLVPPMPDNDMPIPPPAQVEAPVAPSPVPRIQRDSQPPPRSLRASVPMPDRSARLPAPTRPPAPSPALRPVPPPRPTISTPVVPPPVFVPAIPAIPSLPKRLETDPVDTERSGFEGDGDIDQATVSRVPIEITENTSKTNVADVSFAMTADDHDGETNDAGMPISRMRDTSPSAEPILDGSAHAAHAAHAAHDHARHGSEGGEAATVPARVPALRPTAPPIAAMPAAMSRLPISTAPNSLPPPRDGKPTAGPSPACPQCESPMAWVEEHLRFYCKSCRMYF
jgi:hypothetical protein